MNKIESADQYKSWIESEDWYQTMHLAHGLSTKGKFATDRRESFFQNINFKDKRVLDIGCNSGQYCFFAKKNGASEVIGVDINEKRLGQAKIINEYEGYGVRFHQMSIDSLSSLGSFDIVLCIAVLTEIQDLIGAIEIIKKTIGDIAFIELDIARLPLSLEIVSKLSPFSHFDNIFAKGRQTKKGWMISPSFKLLKNIFGNSYSLQDLGKSVRYRMVKVKKTDD